MKLSLVIINLLVFGQAQRFLIINDIHLNLSATYYMPMPGMETNRLLLNTVLQNALDKSQKEGFSYNAIILPGDQVCHGLASNVDPNLGIPNPNWPLMLETMYEVMTTIATYFPNTPILPSIGNNDVDYHDQAPELDAAT